MVTNCNSDFNLNNENIKRTVIPDNDYLPFVPIKNTLVNMKPGEITAWPDSKANSVRILAGRISKQMGRKYRCMKNRKEKTVDVCRFS